MTNSWVGDICLTICFAILIGAFGYGCKMDSDKIIQLKTIEMMTPHNCK